MQHLTEGSPAFPSPLSNTLPSLCPISLLLDVWEGTGCGVFVLEVLENGTEFRYIAFNPSMIETEVIPVAPLIGKTVSEVLPPDAAALYGAYYRKVAQSGETLAFEEPLSLGGKDTWWSFKVIPTRNELGQVDRLVVTAIDITAQKAALQEREQTEAQLREQAKLLAFRADVDAALVQSGALRSLLTRCTDAIVTHLDAAFARIWTLNSQENVLELQASSGLYTHINGGHQRVPVGQFKIGLIAAEREPHLTNSVLTDPRVGDKAWAKREGMVALAGYPLIVDDQLLGVIAMFARQPLPDSVLQALQIAAGEIALGIKRKQAEAQLREYADRQALLNRLTIQIRNSLHLDEVLAIAVREIYFMLQLNFCRFAWFYPNAEPPMWEVVQEAKAEGLYSALGTYPTLIFGSIEDRLMRQGLIQIDDAEQYEESIYRAFLQQHGIRSEVLIPIQTQSGKFGILICDRYYLQPWTTSEIELLQSVADQLAIAIDQAALYTQAQAKTQELEQTIKELQRAQAQVVQAEKMSSLGQLVAGIAHEINNLVNFIHGNLAPANDYAQDLLELIELYQECYPEPKPAIADKIEAIDLEFLKTDLLKLLSSMSVGTNRIREIVRSLRIFSRLDEAEVKAVNLHEGIDSTLMILQHRIKESPNRIAIEIIKDYDPLPPVQCYVGQLNQVFMNILGNEIDALEELLEKIPAHLPRITIRTEQIDSAWVKVSIADNGTGMPEEIRQRIFDPFFTTKPVGKGTGMGMPISYQIVTEKHGGKLDCFSTPGAGTEFVIQIPILQPIKD